MNDREQLVLRPYQERMEDHVIDHYHCALWADMGAGKTATLLSAIVKLLAMLDISKVLVVAPKRVAAHTWPAEVKRWAQFAGLTVRAITAADFAFERREVTIKRKRETTTVKRLVPTIAPGALLTGEVIHTISRDLLPQLVSLLKLSRWPYDMIVLDDCGLRDLTTAKCRAIKALRKHTPARMVQLSGTPRPKSLVDIWPQLYLIDQGERLGRTQKAFLDCWFVPDQRSRDRVFSHRPRNDVAEAEIFAAVGDVCVSLLPEDVVQLPELSMNVVTLAMDNRARELYLRLAARHLITLNCADVTASNAAVLVGKLLQLASGAVYDEDGRVHEVHTAKLDYLDEVIEAQPGVPLLVGYWFQHERDRIKARYPHAVELEDYPDTEDRWNRGEIEMLLLHPQGGAHGLNLQFNDGQGFWFGPIHNLELWQQWNKRLHRPGRKTPVVIHVPIMANTIEGAVLESLTPKAAGQQRLLEAVRLGGPMPEFEQSDPHQLLEAVRLEVDKVRRGV